MIFSRIDDRCSVGHVVAALSAFLRAVVNDFILVVLVFDVDVVVHDSFGSNETTFAHYHFSFPSQRVEQIFFHTLATNAPEEKKERKKDRQADRKKERERKEKKNEYTECRSICAGTSF